ncbi:MAG: glycosyltransferase family 9 protein [Verrucomicrobia bacterium]|nr:glycosyltransferase family 9 protein [Verrucomicrobiota bacterium]
MAKLGPPPPSGTSPFRRLYRWAYWLPRDWSIYLRYGRPRKVVYFGGTGFGDDLLLSTVLYELRARGERRLGVISRLTELFEHAPYVDAVIKDEWRALAAVERFGGTTIRPVYYTRHAPPHYDVPSTQHIITAMCQSAGIRGPVALRTYLCLEESERNRGQLRANQAVIQCTAPQSLNFSPLKHWYAERYQEVVDKLSHRLNFIQLGSLGDPPLRGAVDLRGKTTARESAAILSRSRVCITYVGFLMHLARAVDTRAVVVFGGRERPDQSGYACNENLFTALPCSPCWLRRHCLENRECMDRITSDDVVAAVERALAKVGNPLEVVHEDAPDGLQDFALPWQGRYQLPPP